MGTHKGGDREGLKDDGGGSSHPAFLKLSLTLLHVCPARHTPLSSCAPAHQHQSSAIQSPLVSQSSPVTSTTHQVDTLIFLMPEPIGSLTSPHDNHTISYGKVPDQNMANLLSPRSPFKGKSSTQLVTDSTPTFVPHSSSTSTIQQALDTTKVYTGRDKAGHLPRLMS